MKKKLLLTLGGSVLSAMIFAGCTRDQVPPPEKNVDVKNTNYRQDNMNTDRNTNYKPNTTNPNTTNPNTTNPNVNTDRYAPGNQGHFPTSEDKTGGGDVMKDRNTPKEEIIEDRKDRLDKDNIDR